MRTGLLAKVLARRYGQPIIFTEHGLDARRWEAEKPDDSSILYVGMNWRTRLGTRFASLKEIYGDAFGGFLVGDSIKVAVLLPRKIFGLWRIDELQMLPAVRQALEMDPAIDFFMDSANVWYYGHKAGELYVFDSETDELDSLGPIEPALATIMDQWEAAGGEVPGLK